MAFEATKREWSELYVFFRLLADGKVSLGTPQAKKEDEKYRPIAMIQREEHDGTRRYYIEEEVIRMEGEDTAYCGRQFFLRTEQNCVRSHGNTVQYDFRLRIHFQNRIDPAK